MKRLLFGLTIFSYFYLLQLGRYNLYLIGFSVGALVYTIISSYQNHKKLQKQLEEELKVLHSKLRDPMICKGKFEYQEKDYLIKFTMNYKKERGYASHLN